MPPHDRNPYLRLPLPPKGMLYGIDTKYFRPGAWIPMREGSNIEVPSFRLVDTVAQIPLAAGKSKKLYEAAVATAFLAARVRGVWNKTGKGNVALHHFARLRRRAS